MQKTQFERKELNLPDKPSELIELAMKDLEKCEEASATYCVAMGNWHNPNGRCKVCLAGAVMAQTGKTNPNEEYSPLNFTSVDKMYALDDFRVGEIWSALNMMNIPFDDRLPMEMRICSYMLDREKFKEDMDKLISKLKDVGL